MGHFHHGAERGLSVLFHLFSGPTKSWFYRGQQTGLSRAEYAKLERGALATGLQLQQDGHI